MTITCTAFKNLINDSQKLHYTLHMLYFDSAYSRQITLSGDDNRLAALSRKIRSEYGYPGWKNQVAFVADAAQVPRFVHFLVTEPGNFVSSEPFNFADCKNIMSQEHIFALM